MRLSGLHKFVAAVCAVALNFAKAAEGGEVTVVRYSKSDLANVPKESDFIQTRDLSDLLSSKFKQLMVTITQRQSGSNTATRSVVESWRPYSHAARMKKLSTLALSPDQLYITPNESILRDTLAKQSRKAIEVNVRSHFPIIETIRSGMKFSLDLKNPTKSIPIKREVPVIRYGLVESEIIPAENPVAIAALGSISDIAPEFGSPAKVIYTIDKLPDQTEKPVFATADNGDQILQNTSMWAKLPSTSMNVKVDAADQDAVMSDQVSSGAMPGAKFTITQADGFFSTQFVAGGKSNLKKSMMHQVQAPLYGEMSLARQYDHQMRATQTSALNILGDSRRPRLNLTYVHKERRAKGELVIKNNGADMSVLAEPRQGWKPNGFDKLGQPGDRISFAFSKSF